MDGQLTISDYIKTFNWEKFVGLQVRVIEGGFGARGANGKVGLLIPKNTKCTSGRCESNCPKIKINGIN